MKMNARRARISADQARLNARLNEQQSLRHVGDRDAHAYEFLFSFSTPEEKDQFLELVRSNEDMGDEYIENDFMPPTTEESDCSSARDGPARRRSEPCYLHCGIPMGWRRGQMTWPLRGLFHAFREETASAVTG